MINKRDKLKEIKGQPKFVFDAVRGKRSPKIGELAAKDRSRVNVSLYYYPEFRSPEIPTSLRTSPF